MVGALLGAFLGSVWIESQDFLVPSHIMFEQPSLHIKFFYETDWPSTANTSSILGRGIELI